MHRRLQSAVKLLLAATLTLLLAWAGPATPAFAHAQLLGTSPASGSTVRTQPAAVIFKFSEAVSGTLGAVRVYDAQGHEVDDLRVSHPAARQSWMGVGLEPHLPAGTYTGTYRVISADTHVVYGGVVFNIGRAGAVPRFTVAGLISHDQTGAVTKVAFGVVRALSYLALAVTLGGLAFLLIAWLPSLTALTREHPEWQAAARAFAHRFKRLLAAAIVLGVVVSLLGVLLQGASAAGVSLRGSLKSPIISDTLNSSFGRVWSARAVVWTLLGGLLLLGSSARGRFVPLLADPAASGERTTLTPRPPRWIRVLLGLGAAYLAITPALAGHASNQSPAWVFFPSDVLHVLAASVWVGGVACLLVVLPAATRRLESTERSRLLLAVLMRFSPLALGAVVAIALTGVVQAYIDVRSFDALLHSTYGVLVLVKVSLLLGLIALAAINRGRVIPALQRIAGAGQAAGSAGVRARRTLRSELVLMLGVFGVTAALISYTPPIDAASGPFSANTRIGPLELELTVDPARVGPNTIHLYLIDASSGAQFAATKELSVSASLPSKQIGPLALRANLSGPGHYTLNSALLTPGGDWQLQITDRVSEFDEYTKTVRVPIR